MSVPQTTSLKLDAETKARLKRLGDARRRTPHWLMREAIDQFLTREEARESFRQDALAAWAEFEATGLHVTEAEADGEPPRDRSSGARPPHRLSRARHPVRQQQLRGALPL
jgi:predicted transcriptional regulator